MDMIGHQTISPNINAIANRILTEPFEVTSVIGLDLEHLAVTISPLDDVMREAGDSDTGQASHGGKLPPLGAEGRRAVEGDPIQGAF